MFIGTLYFLGKYRPLYVEGDTAEEVFIQLERRALQAPPEALERLQTLRMSYSPRYTSQSVQHGTYGASVKQAAKHPFTLSIWDDMPPCPGLIYN
jgi:hypothetical protein